VFINENAPSIMVWRNLLAEPRNIVSCLFAYLLADVVMQRRPRSPIILYIHVVLIIMFRVPTTDRLSAASELGSWRVVCLNFRLH